MCTFENVGGYFHPFAGFSPFHRLQPILVQPVLLPSHSLSPPASPRIIETAPLCIYGDRRTENDFGASLDTVFLDACRNGDR